MYGTLPSFVLGFHGCDKSVGLDALNGKEDLKPSKNGWDWLGSGIYFWEHDPDLALAYATDVAAGVQKARGEIETPFVLGAVLNLQNCWNLSSTGGIEILKKGHAGLTKTIQTAGATLPKNIGGNQRYLDRAVVEYTHHLNRTNEFKSFDTVRGAFPEGDPVYDGAQITQKSHIQICVRSKACIRGYFLPRPYSRFNPNYEL